MKKTLIYILPLLFLAACAAPANPTPMPTATPNPGEIAMQMVQQQMAAEATSQVVGLQFTATAQVIGMTSTVQAYATQEAVTQQARNDAQATAEQTRRDAQATQQRIDAEATQAQAHRDAQATADQARLDLQATQQAQATNMAFSMTQLVIPTHNLWTQQAVEQDILIATNHVELSNLEVQQQQQTNTLDWAVPMGIAILLTIGLLAYVYSVAQVREIKDGNGDVQLLIFKNQQAITPHLLPKPVLILDSGEMPDMTNPQEQAEIVRREQNIRALEAMPVNPAGHAVQAFNQYFGGTVEPKKLPTIEIVKPEEIGNHILDEIEGQVVEEG